jgi:hypothetical protein
MWDKPWTKSKAMKMKLDLRTAKVVLGLLAAGCVTETSGGGTDSSSHWLDACQQDSDCSGSLSCHCNVCTLSCGDSDECSSLSANAVCTGDWASCGVDAVAQICAPHREDSGSTTQPTEPAQPTEPTEPTQPAQPTEPTEPTETETLDASPDGAAAITENDLSVCETDDECIVVAYAHCCGATKRAINAMYEDAYASHPEWQSYLEEAPCATIGICRSDSDVTRAQCARNGDEALGNCALVFPEPGAALSGEACQANTDCRSNVCVRTAAPVGAFGEPECSECMAENVRDFACDEDADCCEGTFCCLGCGEREGMCLLP